MTIRFPETLIYTKALISFLFAAFVLFPSRAWAPSAAFPVIGDDQVQWKFDQPARVITIGDIHADPLAFLAILKHRGLIDKQGNWAGGKAHLVMMGDFVDRGPDSRSVLDIVIRLEEQAEAAGGKVHSLVGNHDVMVLRGEMDYAKPSDMQGYADFQKTPEGKKIANTYPFPSKEQAGMQAAFMGDSKYAKWLRNRNSLIQIGNKLYVHAGLTEWPLTVTPGEVNSTVREWIRHYQGKGPKPDPSTAWVLSEPHSPFWNRGQAFGPGFSDRLLKYLAKVGVTEMDQATLDKILAHLNVEQLVIAHSPTESQKIETTYKGKVVRVDTNISIGYGGNLSVMEEAFGQLTKFDNIPRPAADHPVFTSLCRQVNAQSAP